MLPSPAKAGCNKRPTERGPRFLLRIKAVTGRKCRRLPAAASAGSSLPGCCRREGETSWFRQASIFFAMKLISTGWIFLASRTQLTSTTPSWSPLLQNQAEISTTATLQYSFAWMPAILEDRFVMYSSPQASTGAPGRRRQARQHQRAPLRRAYQATWDRLLRFRLLRPCRGLMVISNREWTATIAPGIQVSTPAVPMSATLRVPGHCDLQEVGYANSPFSIHNPAA